MMGFRSAELEVRPMALSFGGDCLPEIAGNTPNLRSYSPDCSGYEGSESGRAAKYS